jgi:hypothetical protein
MLARSVIRAAHGASLSRGATLTKPAFGIVASVSFSIAARFREPVDELIAAKQVPLASYDKGSVQRSSITVGEGAEKQEKEIIPLTRAVYNSMTPSMQKMTLMDKVVVVTGYVFLHLLAALSKEAKADMSSHSGARGLGNSMARACIEAGAKAIIIFDANQDLGDESCAELHKLTGSKVPIDFSKVDVRDEAAIEEAVKVVVEKYGAPDVLINSAGIAE